MYQYKAHVVSVYDGDTLRVDIDCGFYVTLRNMDIRLLGINAPEIKGSTNKQGVASRDALRGRILGKDIILNTQRDKQEKYGRWLATIELDGENINQWMVDKGFAVPFMEG